MLRNYLTITLRRLIRDRGYTCLNILGLTIGMTCTILISLYIRDELSYDRHNENADRIFRVVTDRMARTSAPLGLFIKAQIPEAEQVVRFRPTFGAWLFATEDMRFYERRVYWADQSLFDIFDVPLIRGNPATALAAPFTMVISKSMAQKYFEDKDPIGQIILADNFLEFTITAVMDDPPEYAHYHADFYVSVATMEAREASGEWVGLTIATGRNLDFVRDTRMVSSPNGSYPAPTGCLLNEEAVRRLGWTSPTDALDQVVSITGQELRVIGVIRDFHLKTLHEKIEPMIISFGEDGIFGIRLAPGNPSETLAKLQKMWEESRPHIPFSYTFLDDDVDRLYRADQTLGRLITLFAFLTVLTACLGLSGLAALTTQQRTKEIGVRKVLGASVGQMLLLLSREFTLLVLIANLIAWPVAYTLMTRWLQAFAYHTDISLALFPGAALLALIIAWLTVGLQTIKSATANPVESLRYE